MVTSSSNFQLPLMALVILNVFEVIDIPCYDIDLPMDHKIKENSAHIRLIEKYILIFHVQRISVISPVQLFSQSVVQVDFQVLVGLHQRSDLFAVQPLIKVSS